MFLRIATMPPKKLVGLSTVMSLEHNKTFKLWSNFGPKIKEITSMKGSERYSIEIYDTNFFEQFDPTYTFTKWAAVEVENFNNIIGGLETWDFTGGLYAVFLHKGVPADAPQTYSYIFQQWLPNAIYQLDDRPHIAIMGKRYKHNEPDSEEELWIPIRTN